MKVGYSLGNVLFMTKIETVTLFYPTLPVVLLFLLTAILFALAITIKMTMITMVWPFFLICCFVGALDGSMFTSFLFNAFATTDLPCNIPLHFREIELCVNMMLIS